LATSCVWIRLLLSTKLYISPSRHDRAQDSLTPGGDNQVVRENDGWSTSPRAQGSLLLMLGVLRRIGQHGGRYDPSTRERERERERERDSHPLFLVLPHLPDNTTLRSFLCYCVVGSVRGSLHVCWFINQ